MTAAQVRFHTIATVLSLGLWLPVFTAVIFLRSPRTWNIHVTAEGKVMVIQL